VLDNIDRPHWPQERPALPGARQRGSTRSIGPTQPRLRTLVGTMTSGRSAELSSVPVERAGWAVAADGGVGNEERFGLVEFWELMRVAGPVTFVTLQEVHGVVLLDFGDTLAAPQEESDKGEGDKENNAAHDATYLQGLDKSRTYRKIDSPTIAAMLFELG
jgi:hypothetical protein